MTTIAHQILEAVVRDYKLGKQTHPHTPHVPEAHGKPQRRGRTRPTEAAERTRYVFVERPRCPCCGSADLQTTRSTTHADAAIERRTQCRTCFAKFIVIVE